MDSSANVVRVEQLYTGGHYFDIDLGSVIGQRVGIYQNQVY